MHLLRNVLLSIHVGTGGLALAAGFVALASQKGQLAHRRAGRIFFFSMCAMNLTALGLSLVRPSGLLLYVNGLSAYSVARGQLALARRGLHAGDAVPRSHRAPAAALVAWSIAFGAWGAAHAHALTILFALLGLQVGVSAYRSLAEPVRHASDWLLDHLAGFASAYITAVTAVVVVNGGRFVARGSLGSFALWLVPPAIGIAWIALARRRLRAAGPLVAART